MSAQDYYSAAQCWVMHQGKRVGGATGFRANRNTDHFRVRELGSLSDVEHVPVSRTVSGSFSSLVLANNSLMSQGLIKRGDSDVITAKAANLELYDHINDRTVIGVIKARFESENFTLNDGSITMEDVTFVAIALTDETEPEAA